MNSQKFKDKITLTVQENNSGIRIDKFVSDSIEEVSRSIVKDLIEKKFITSSVKEDISPSDKTIFNEQIKVCIPAKELQTLPAKNVKFDILFEDDDMAVIDKPSGITVHPGAGTENNTLVNGLIHQFGENLSNIGGEERPGIVHRLDKNTSGLMMIAKTNKAHLTLSKMIQNREIDRWYIAVVYGMPKPANGTINKNIARSNRDRTKMMISPLSGKIAITHYKTLKVFKNGAASIVECKLETGRTHQIRLHLDSIGAPVIGDPEYGSIKSFKLHSLGNEAVEAIQGLKGQTLHSCKLSFTHFITKQKLDFQSPLPNDINNLINCLK
ncbi:MAG: RluA family pseudouridine synthase [Rickettsiales bacterium]